MGVTVLIQYITNALFLFILLVVAVRAMRQRNRVWVEISLFFSCATVLVTDNSVLHDVTTHHQSLVDALNVALVVATAFLLARMINNLSMIPRAVMWASEIAFVLLVAGALAIRNMDSPLILLPVVAYFATVVVFTAVVTASEGIRSSGLARRRMLAIAGGSAFLSLAVVLAGVRSAFPTTAGISHSLVDGPLALAAGLAYFVGFATPRFLRRSWQDQVLREFFARTVTLTRLSDPAEIAFGLETGARRSVGARAAYVGLWDAASARLWFPTRADGVEQLRPGQMVEGKVFVRQRPIAVSDLQHDDESNAAYYRERGINAVICAPISLNDQCFGVIAVYASRAPVFADDDLEVVMLIADQAAIILESHGLIEQSTRLRAREEATRLKDDFLAAAAHDLKNPLAALVMQAQLIDRRIRRHPNDPPDRRSIQNLIDQANRLETFVSDLLDVQRVESQGLLVHPVEMDLAELIRAAASLIPGERHHPRLELQEPMIVMCDRSRIIQLIDNLLSNAVKYSPNGGEIVLRLWREDDRAHFTVQDQGIGIPEADLTHVFERFHRGSNTEGTRLRGVGLGLFICQAVVQAHGGSISVSSEPGMGTEFHVVLPVDRDFWSGASSKTEHVTPEASSLPVAPATESRPSNEAIGGGRRSGAP